MEDYEKAWKELAEALKKEVDLELVFWGTPFATAENGMCVLKGDVTNFEKLWGNPKIRAGEMCAGKKFPITDRRTNFILN